MVQQKLDTKKLSFRLALVLKPAKGVSQDNQVFLKQPKFGLAKKNVGVKGKIILVDEPPILN